jgi:23S rRNA (uracil1939-C5)-methyltransferase
LNTIDLKIERISNQGHGIGFHEEKTVMVPKAAIGDLVQVTVTKIKKNLFSGTILRYLHKGAHHNTPVCRHFYQCPSCSMQHIPYSEQLEIKKLHLSQLLKPLNGEQKPIQVFKADSLYHYRNRLQLHYKKSPLQLGYKHGEHITSINQCPVALPQIEEWIQSHHSDTLVGNEGHVEIYMKETLSLAFNEHYAHGGFSQVNKEMNDKLCHELDEFFKESCSGNILDLFCGNGNLLKNITTGERFGADSYIGDSNPYEHKKIINLYEKNSLEQLSSLLTNNPIEAILLDPPRSGWLELSHAVKLFKPKFVIYVSCWPSTMIRDLTEIIKNEQMTLKKVMLFDFFPQTSHFETVAILQV